MGSRAGLSFFFRKPSSFRYCSWLIAGAEVTSFNHFDYFFLGLTLIIVADKLTFVVIDNAFLLISEEAFLKLIYTVPSGKFCKGADAGLIKHTSGARKL